MFEIIYPDDQHVVNYDNFDDIILISVFDININKEYDVKLFQELFPIVNEYQNIKDYHNIRNIIDGKNKEGFVVKFENGFRIKLKYEEYVKMHYLKNNLTENKILDYFINNEINLLYETVEKIDEEQKIYFDNIINNFKNHYNKILNICNEDLKNAIYDTRKENALYIKTCNYPSILFAMKFGGNYEVLIWKK